MKSWFVFLACVACACPTKPALAPSSGSAGAEVSAGSAAPPNDPAPTTCDGIRPAVERLYRGEAQQREPNRVDEAVADNTKMVMADCAKDPARVVPCLAKAQTVAELEKQCLVPIDDEGTEGEAKQP